MSVSNFAAMTPTSSVMSRAYYAYFFSKAGCFGSAKVTEKEIFPIDCESFTTKERENFKDALASLQPDILKLASFLNKENENKGDLESTLDLQWALAKRGRPSLDRQAVNSHNDSADGRRQRKT